MSEKSNPLASEPLESEANEANGSESAQAEAYKVGPGRPPRDTRWKKGGPSPNPRGRPRKDRSTLPDFKEIFQEALKRKILVSHGGREVRKTRPEIGLEQLLNQFAKGDRHARREVLQIADKYGIDIWAEHRPAIEAALDPNRQAILDRYVARHRGTAEVAPAARVLAPRELLDDDEPAESETTSSLPPEPKAKMEFPEPTPIPGRKYPKPFSQMTPLQRQIFYPDWWKQHGDLWEKYGR